MLNHLKHEIIEDDERFFALEHEWKELYAASSNASPTLHWAWQSGWWRAFNEGRRLYVVAVRHRQKLVAVLPMYRQVLADGARSMRFLSCCGSEADCMYPDYLDVLCRDGWREQAIQALVPVLRSGEGLDLLMLERFSRKSVVSEVLARLGMFWYVRRSAFVSPQADLSDGFDAFLARCSTESRSRYRRLLRAFERGNFEFRIAQDAGEQACFFNELVSCHQASWNHRGMAGAFRSERILSFHRNLLSRLQPGKEALIARLSDAGGPLALIYGFIAKGKFDFYQSGVLMNRADSVKSPGILAHLLTMRSLAASGVRTYDFLEGEADYKTKLATHAAALQSVSLYRPSLATALVFSRRAFERLSLGTGVRSLVPDRLASIGADTAVADTNTR